MADTRTIDLPAGGAVPEPTDLIYLLDDPGGTPADKKLTVANLLGTGVANAGTPGNGSTTTFNATTSGVHSVTCTAVSLTFAFAGWKATATDSEVALQIINGGLALITWPTVNWAIGAGAYSTTFADTGVTLNTSGANHAVIWTYDAGTTLYGVVA